MIDQNFNLKGSNILKVLIIGANGQIGQHLIKKLQESGRHQPVAMVRKEDQQLKFESQGVKTALVDLEESVDKIAEAMKEVGAIVFTAGSGGHTGADQTLMIDLDGAIKSMKAAKKANVKRFVIVSAIGIHQWHENNHPEWMDRTPYYSAAKYYADVWLENSGLDYTIIRPGGLTNESGTGKIEIGDNLQMAMIPRKDVATTIATVLENNNTIGKAFDLTSGQIPIEEAIKTL